jgi:hypothetical protein
MNEDVEIQGDDTVQIRISEDPKFRGKIAHVMEVKKGQFVPQARLNIFLGDGQTEERTFALNKLVLINRQEKVGTG